jgi:hypothetical protein
MSTVQGLTDILCDDTGVMAEGLEYLLLPKAINLLEEYQHSKRRVWDGRTESDKSALTPARAEGATTGQRGKVRLENRAIGMDEKNVWHVFRRTKGRWLHYGRLKRISKGWQTKLLRAFLEGHGFFDQGTARKIVRETNSDADRPRIMNTLKAPLSRLRDVVCAAMKIQKDHQDPFPYDDARKGWCAAIQVGYATLNDDGRWCFRTESELAEGEHLDYD